MTLKIAWAKTKIRTVVSISIAVLLGVAFFWGAREGFEAICVTWPDLMMCKGDKKFPWKSLIGLVFALPGLFIGYWLYVWTRPREPYRENRKDKIETAFFIYLAGLLGAAFIWGVLEGFQAICITGKDPMMCEGEKNLPWTLLGGLAAAPAGLLIWYWRTTHKKADIANAEAIQLTNRFSVAVEMLAKSSVWTLGGIYALERIARDSTSDHSTVVNVLAAFVRAMSPELSQLLGSAHRISASHICAAIEVLSRLPRTDESHIDLYGAMLSGLRLVDLDLKGTELLYANLSDADLKGTDLSGANLRSANLSHADLMAAICSGALLSSANLSDANLKSARFVNAKLKKSDLSRATLSFSDLSHADLFGAKLIGADLSEAFLFNTILIGANLSGTILQGASIVMADLTGADLTSADLQDADLAGSKITVAQVKSARNYSSEHLAVAAEYEQRLPADE